MAFRMISSRGHTGYKSHAAAQALAESILNTLENAHNSGQLEQYSKN
ncbi:hypothetical protein [Methanospirillum hungatei]|nr:hypothetical protein [Methanospirillum hungatei]MCA1915200.1 hypothetical protein [Methanospirillum hungatei]